MFAVQTNQGLDLKARSFLQGFRAMQKAYKGTNTLYRVSLIEFPSQKEVAYIEPNTHWSEVQFIGLSPTESADKCNELWTGIKAYSDKGLTY